MEGFRHTVPIAVRFRDIDAMGHVNNAVFFTYLETARVDYMRNVALRTRSQDLSESGLILAQITCQFKKPIFYGESVEVGSRVAEMRNSSFSFLQLAALAEGVVVSYDYQAGKSVGIPQEVRARIESFEAEGKAA